MKMLKNIVSTSRDNVYKAVSMYSYTALSCDLQDGTMFKARLPFAPYFYLQVGGGCVQS